jgi:hypothetical protein
MRRFRMRARRPSPALVISLVALFVALEGTSLGSSLKIPPLALHAKTADKAKVASNALKLDNQTAAQIAATPGPATTLGGLTADQIAATPGPTSSAAGLVTVRSTGWSNASDNQGIDWYAQCQPGEKAIGGGWDEIQGNARFTYNRPTPDDTAWWVHTYTAANTAPASGSIWVVCLK